MSGLFTPWCGVKYLAMLILAGMHIFHFLIVLLSQHCKGRYPGSYRLVCHYAVCQLRTSLYDKRDDFNFHITNFPFLSSNIPSSPAYGVFVSQLVRYARACSSYECFILRAARLSSKLLGQGYVMERLKSSLRKFYGRYGDLIKHYEVSLSQMLHDILGHDHIQ